MHTIHTIFTIEQISGINRFLKNLTIYSVEGAPPLNKENYSNLLPLDFTSSFPEFRQNVTKLCNLNKKAVVILPPFPDVVEFYLCFCEFVIVRFEGKRKFFRENYPDMTLSELYHFDNNFKGNKEKTLIEFSGVCKDCNINAGTFKYFTLSQANLKMYVKGSSLFKDELSTHNYYTYTDEQNSLHIVWFEDNLSISSYYNFLKEKNYGGISWKNPSHTADGNWEAMYSVKSKL